MSGLGAADLAVLALGALLVGIAKTAIGGVGAISVALFAAVLPARESSGALLPLLIVGDLFAVHAYRRHVDWPALLRLFPSVAAGVLVGAVFVAGVDDTAMRRTIGGLLLAVVAVHLWQRRRRRRAAAEAGPAGAPPRPAGRWVAFCYGLLAGFTTMVANAGGAVMSLYLLAAGYAMLTFLGTAAWFFLIVNLFKVPFSAGLGLITADSLALNAALLPALLLGAFIGRAGVKRLDQKKFERLVLAFTVVASLNLLR
ncbi:sulfite exporter TauE/SafE family protein [Streptomyces marincola]|uniref:sulfite exporter TauE/SafE family protein n=1 Tax=Streptomyces marincola TaxID=2878388 RepID=UPI001CF3E629|nr:sulfite exporter TauE/SafE family protein [Streptomyces marincola]UCM88967.1 sulfite exporter TauE/SafE family protein [Streptomyces marincola]